MFTRAALVLALAATVNMTQTARAADPLTMETLSARLAAKPSGADAEALANQVRAFFGKDRAGKYNVLTGANPKVRRLETAWAIEAPGAKKAVVVTGERQEPAADPDRRDARLRRHVPDVAHGSAFRWSYVSRRQHAWAGSGQVEVYTDQPELAEKPGVPKGKLTHQKPWESKIYPGTTRQWWVYVPAQYKDDQPACVMVFQDGGGYTGFVPTVFDNLIAKGEMPVTVAIFINPGNGRAKTAAASAASSTTRSPTATRGSCSRRSCPRSRRP